MHSFAVFPKTFYDTIFYFALSKCAPWLFPVLEFSAWYIFRLRELYAGNVCIVLGQPTILTFDTASTRAIPCGNPSWIQSRVVEYILAIYPHLLDPKQLPRYTIRLRLEFRSNHNLGLYYIGWLLHEGGPVWPDEHDKRVYGDQFVNWLIIRQSFSPLLTSINQRKPFENIQNTSSHSH